MSTRIATLLIALCVTTTFAAAAEVDVYLLGGQSNMQGIGKLANLPADVPKAIPHTQFWNSRAGRFEPLVLGQTQTSSRAGEFGPEVGFALGMATADRPICLVKYHASGQPLHHGWSGNKWVGGEPGPARTNFYPGEKPDDPCAGRLYRSMLAKYCAAIAHLKSQGHTPVVKGFVWMQGEQDSKHEVSATSYATSLRRLRDRLGQDLGLGEPLPIVFGQVLPYEPAMDRFTHRKEIRAQMAAADEASGEADAIDDAKMVSTDGLGLLPDTVHYNAAGQLRLGREFAEAMQEIQDD